MRCVGWRRTLEVSEAERRPPRPAQHCEIVTLHRHV